MRLLLGALGLAVALAGGAWVLLGPPAPSGVPEPALTWAEIEARVSPAVARVSSRHRFTTRAGAEQVVREARGSGVLVAPTLVLTSSHVVQPRRDAASLPPASLETLSVQLPGQQAVPATLFAIEEAAGLALLQVPFRPTPPLALARPDEGLEVAEEVAFLLHPPDAGPEPAPVPLLWKAAVARIERDSAGQPKQLALDRSEVVGGGGGPVLNRRGEVVGLVLEQAQAAADVTSTASLPPAHPARIVQVVPVSILWRFLHRSGVAPALSTAP